VNPAAKLLPIRIPVSVARLAPDDVIQIALLTASTRDAALIGLGRFACPRLSELTSLHTRARVHDELRIFGKGEKERMVNVNDDLMHILLKREDELGGRGGFYSPEGGVRTCTHSW
jgi:integrase/recombinase XerC